ncbi:cell division protein ScpA [Bifidobacterium margollesii]|uniref:Segregation and condensation protein A n=1 Tax=Bifidobacterium margollesii TaxID=2020964 RepID=A0A2N5J8I8_9BIFI|nr:ScpA family protein [Bifidobacterium margollesii]PLS30524.1 cell division protein ScpA [Bifidobacterium margollesii]
MNVEGYSGPFDVLLGLLANRRLELTEVSLAQITGEFLDYIGGMDLSRDMDEASSFIDVASILVEAKSVALLPDTDDAERDERSMEALRERDLLFARLLQYRAFKRAAADFRALIETNAGWHAHPGTVDAAPASAPAELVRTVDAAGLARIAARVIANAPADEVSVGQLHVPLVDLRAQATVVRDRLRSLSGGSTTFDELTQDASVAETVARFLALLAFFRQGSVQFRQDGPYAVLHVRWVVDDAGWPADDDIVSILAAE